MSKLGLVVLLSILSGKALSQDYFVFIGNDSHQPFYARIDSQVYTSSAAGHLLIAPLKDTAYVMTLGFPGQLYPEKQYVLNIRGKDREFQLRRTDDGAWGLWDLLSKNALPEIQKDSVAKETRSAGIKKDDAFSRMMAGVVHDTAVLYNTYAMEQTLVDSPATVRPPDSATVVQLSENKSPGSVQLVYADRKGNKPADTVVVIIPKDTAATVPTTSSTAAASVIDTTRRPPKPSVYINSDCHNFATDYDIDKLRAKMLAAAKDDDRVSIARKVFKTKCFYTPQIRALSEVFTTDASKYRFLETAWPFAADEHFQELGALLTDPVYLAKFRKLTGAQP